MGWSSRGRLLLILCSIQIAQSSRSLRRDSGYQPKEGDTLVHEVRLASFDESTSTQQSTQPLVNNIVIQVYLNAKNTSTIKSSKVITSGLNIGQSPLGSPENPIIISKDFDREALKFIDEENVAEYNPTNMVEVKAVVYGVGGDENRMVEGEQMEKRINKEFQSSIPAIRERLNGLKKDSQLTENHFLLERSMKKRETDEQTSVAADQPISLTGASDTNESVRDEPSASEGSAGSDFTWPMGKSEAGEEANNTDDDVLSSDLDRLIEEGMDEISPGSEGSPINEAEEEKLIGDEIEKTLMHEFGEDSADIITTTIPNYELPSSINPSPLPVTSTATPFIDDGTVNIVDQAIYSTASFKEQNAEISDDEFNAVTTEKTPAATNDELDLQDSEVGTTQSFDTMRTSTESAIVEGVQVLLDAQTETTTIPIQQTSTESGLVDRVEVAIESAIATTTAETDTDRNTFPNEVIKTKTGILEMSEEEEPSTVSILDLENVETTTTLSHSTTEAVEMATEQFTNDDAESEIEELGSLIVLETEFDSTESDSTTEMTSNNVPVESEVTSQSSDTNFDTFFNSRNGGENNREITGKSASSDSSETKTTEGTLTSQETSTTTRTTVENTDAMLSMETVGLQEENVQKTDGISSTSAIPTVTDASVLSESGESGLSRTDVETLGGERLITSETRQEGENKGISSEGATEQVASSEMSESKDIEETSASPDTVTTAENTVESTDALFTIETNEQQAGSIEKTEEITTPAIPATTEGDESFMATTSEASSDVSSPHNDDEMFLVKAVGEDGVGVSNTEQNKSTEHINSSEIPSTTQIPEKAFVSSEIGPPGTEPEAQENTVLAVEEIEQEGKNVKDNTAYNEENASSNFATTSEIPPTGETMASSVTFEHDLITDTPSEKLAEQTSQSTQSGGLEVVTQTFDTSSTLSKTTLQVAATAESDGITTLIPEADEAEEGAENNENNRQTQARTTTNAPQLAAVEPSSQGTCSMPNDKSDNAKRDVLFLLDTSASIGEGQFDRAIELIRGTVKGFRNIGPDGTQVSLVQFNHEPYLEFSFRRHDCKSELLDDIDDTEYMNGASKLGNAIEKVAKFGFNRRRGDRPDAPNVLVILTDGTSDDKIQRPLEMIQKDGTTVLVIATMEAQRELINELTNNQDANVFNLTDSLDQSLADRLTSRIINVSNLEASAPPVASSSQESDTKETTSSEITPTSVNDMTTSGEFTSAPQTIDQLESGSPVEMTSASERSSEEPSTLPSFSRRTSSGEIETAAVKEEQQSMLEASNDDIVEHFNDSTQLPLTTQHSVTEPTTTIATPGSVETTLNEENNEGLIESRKDGEMTEPNTATTESDSLHDRISTPGMEEAVIGQVEEAIQENTTTEENLPKVETSSTVSQTTSMSRFSDTTQQIGIANVECYEHGFNLTIRLPETFGGMITVKGHSVDEGCYKVVEEVVYPSDSSSTMRSVNFFVDARKCDIKKVDSLEPAGVNTSAVVNVLHHKWLVTGVDKGYLIQCFMPKVDSEQDLSTDLYVNGSALVGETLSLASVPPTCLYSLRRDSPNGPIAKSANVGETIYHHWECDGGDVANEVYGMHIHDCYAASDTNREYPVVNTKGCSLNKDILSDLNYADDRLLATAKSNVFTLADVEHLLFHCKVSLCTRNADGCEGITPPMCSNQNDTDLLLREVRQYPEAISAALTSDLQTNVDLSSSSSWVPLNQNSIASDLTSLRLAAQSPWFWWLVVSSITAILLTVCLIRYIRRINAKTVTDVESAEIHKNRWPDLGSSFLGGSVSPVGHHAAKSTSTLNQSSKKVTSRGSDVTSLFIGGDAFDKSQPSAKRVDGLAEVITVDLHSDSSDVYDPSNKFRTSNSHSQST